MKKDMELANEVIRISGANPIRCMKCGKCSASCPSFNEMEYAPHKFVDMVVHGRIEELMESKSIFDCLSCFACVERCPRGVEPAKIVEAIRVVKQRQKRKEQKSGASFLRFQPCDWKNSKRL